MTAHILQTLLKGGLNRTLHMKLLALQQLAQISNFGELRTRQGVVPVPTSLRLPYADQLTSWWERSSNRSH